MPITRKWFDWSRPALPQAAGWLAGEFARRDRLDLQKVIVAVPGGQVGRRLLELLVAEAEGRGLALTPPRIVTPSELPELLYPAKRQFADSLAQQLAWARVLRETEPRRLAALVRQRSADDDLAAWLALGKTLAKVHRDLAADMLDCGDVLQHGRQVAGFDEAPRWELLRDLQTSYLGLLDDLNLWDVQTARRFAIEHHECQTDQQIVLVGLVDLNRSQRLMLDQVASQVTALVFAPPEMEKRFDEHGCLIADRWQEPPADEMDGEQSGGRGWTEGKPRISRTGASLRSSPGHPESASDRDSLGASPLFLRAEQIEVADGPGEQTDAVLRAMAAWKGRYSAEQITIGVPDVRLVPYLRQRLAEADLPARYGPGMPLERTGPYQLLAEAADYLDGRRYRDLAALVRHPAVGEWLLASGEVSGDWLTSFDRFFGDHLPDQIGDKLSGKADSIVRRVQGKIAGLMARFIGGARPLHQWSPEILRLIVEVYGTATLDERIEAQRAVIKACDAITDALKNFADLDPQLSPPVTAAQALRLLLAELSGESIPPPADAAAIELLGWLELPWDDAPALVVSGFNEGFVPQSRSGDPFLPDALRGQLQLEDNRRRYARDCYALCLLAHSRQELRIVAGRRTADGDALVPSRLLLACDDAELPARTRALLARPQDVARRVLLVGSLRPGQEGESLLPVPLAEALRERVASMRVTEFRDYLACPYRYYLRHRLGLEALDDSAPELDGGGFGNLLHEVLRDFGRGAARDSTNSEEIRAELFVRLGELAAGQFGKGALPAVRVQMEMLRLRLEKFAEIQAQWRAAGWRIECVEEAFNDERPAVLDVDGEPVRLRGRIDRIDRNEATGQLVVLDYKSSDRGDSPDKVHRDGPKDGKEWIDLQLPLYRHMVPALSLDAAGPLKLGYVLLPKDTAAAKFELAEWTDAELAEADETARWIVRQIRAEVFTPADLPPSTFPEFAAICQEGRLAAPPSDEEEDEA